ncbi:MAG: hypothetical protein DWB56_08080 [Candidatus Jettenia sp.]|nr:hypothetical protein [Candidatus Jettenia sp.]
MAIKRGIAVVVISLGKSTLKQITNFTQLHTDILRYFSFDVEIYQPLKTTFPLHLILVKTWITTVSLSFHL